MQSFDVWCMYAVQEGNIRLVYAHCIFAISNWWINQNQPSMAVETVRAVLETIVHISGEKATRHRILTIQHLMNNSVSLYVYRMLCRADDAATGKQVKSLIPHLKIFGDLTRI